MKKLMKFPTYLFLAFLSLAAVSCDSDDDVVDPGLNNSAYDLTKENPNFSTLGLAVERADLVDILDSAGTYTVFAPTNDAFTDFLSDNDFATLNDVPVDVLRATLLYHVLGTEVRSTGLSQGYVKTASLNANGDAYDAHITLTPDVLINDAEIDLSSVDIAVDNGVVHVIDEVLTLPTVADLADFNPDFSNLVAALEQQNLVDALENTETTGAVPAPFTVFAPTNDSFQALIDADPADGINSIGDILALPTLTDILLYHVVSGAEVRAGDISDGLVVDPVTMGTFMVNTANGVVITDGTNTMTNVTATDVTATNGVVHVVDFVLRP